jgi:surfactin synthase thioesterase subunit
MEKPDKIILIFLPFAGGNKNSYRGIQKQLADIFNILNIEFPGRGSRMKEKLLFSISEIAEDVFSQLKNYLHYPYAIYGHSMGTLIAYELCKKIQNQNLPLPLHLFVSGKSGPSAGLNYDKMYNLPTKEFWIKIKDMGGVPVEILNEPELMNYFEPILRADLKAVEEYTYQLNAKFDFPITVLIGDKENISDEHAMLWQQETSHALNFYKLPGNHFFIFNDTDQLADIFMKKLRVSN